ncbi:MAG TPA: limonene-1,2-epoxide hydrolase family protein [Vicinamibacterales bacterium]|nr:limonene-1,2-epoxide hydrolase family protein [Vicinamibacterales bacterium]
MERRHFLTAASAGAVWLGEAPSVGAADSSLVEFKILDAKAARPIVVTHRIDRFLTKQPLTWEGVGVFFVKDVKIKEWSDYTMRVQR